MNERALLPQPLKWEGKLQLVLPKPVTDLMTDIHNDRSYIGGFAVLIAACLVAITWKYISNKK